jgi:hypothetical protein
VAQAYRKQYGGTLNVTQRVTKSLWILEIFVIQVARRVKGLILSVKRTCGIYANEKRRKRGGNTDPLLYLKPDGCRRSRIWLEDFGTFDRKSQLLTILILGYQRWYPNLLLMYFRCHIWPLKSSYGLRSHVNLCNNS